MARFEIEVRSVGRKAEETGSTSEDVETRVRQRVRDALERAGFDVGDILVRAAVIPEPGHPMHERRFGLKSGEKSVLIPEGLP